MLRVVRLLGASIWRFLSGRRDAQFGMAREARLLDCADVAPVELTVVQEFFQADAGGRPLAGGEEQHQHDSSPKKRREPTRMMTGPSRTSLTLRVTGSMIP